MGQLGQLFEPDQMKIFSDQQLFNLGPKMAYFGQKYAVLGDFWVRNIENILSKKKWLIMGLLGQLFEPDQMKIFLDHKLLNFGPKIAYFGQKVQFYANFELAT